MPVGEGTRSVEPADSAGEEEPGGELVRQGTEWPTSLIVCYTNNGNMAMGNIIFAVRSCAQKAPAEWDLTSEPHTVLITPDTGEFPARTPSKRRAPAHWFITAAAASGLP